MPLFKGKPGLFLFLVVVIGLFTVILVYSDNGLIRLTELKTEKARLEAENGRLREKNRRLLQQIERIKTDPRYIEDEARKKLGLIRPDEKIYKLAEETDDGYPVDVQP